MVYGPCDVFSPKDGPFGVATISEFIWGISPNIPKRGLNRQFQAKLAEYINHDILQNVNTINVQF